MKEHHYIANIRGWLSDINVYWIVDRIKCFFKGHKYNYSLAWGEKGGYNDIYIVCDRCNHPYFLKFHKSDVPFWQEEKDKMTTEIAHWKEKAKKLSTD